MESPQQSRGDTRPSLPTARDDMAPSLEPFQIPHVDTAALKDLGMGKGRFYVGKHDNSVPNEALIAFEYLNQGGANVIFHILPWPLRSQIYGQPPLVFLDINVDSGYATPMHQNDITHKVLRVNKGLDKTLRCEEVIAGFYDDVRPLFQPGQLKTLVACNPASGSASQTLTSHTITLPDGDLTKHLMDHEGVVLFPEVMANLSARCNVFCTQKDAKHLTSSRWGILLPDMSPVTGYSITLEVKPKWLAQSPTAPSNAIRCRTCALQITKPKDPTKYFCPIHWIHGDSSSISPWVYERVSEQLAFGAPTEEQMQRTAFLTTHITAFLSKGAGKDILNRLVLLQSQLDIQGVLRRETIYAPVRDLYERNLRLAMTLRDCSMFIKVLYRRYDPLEMELDPPQIDCKLGDLDFKSADKMDDWAAKEIDLLSVDAYTREIDKGLQRDMCCLYPAIRAA